MVDEQGETRDEQGTKRDQIAGREPRLSHFSWHGSNLIASHLGSNAAELAS